MEKWKEAIVGDQNGYIYGPASPLTANVPESGIPNPPHADSGEKSQKRINSYIPQTAFIFGGNRSIVPPYMGVGEQARIP